MAQADVLALVTELSNGQADPVTIASIYQEVVDDWGDLDILTNATLLTVAATEEFTVPASVRNIIGVIWDDTQLGKLTLRELEALDPEWRSRVGSPNSYTDEAETVKTLAFYPTPFAPSGPFSLPPDPLGKDSPVYSVVLIHSEGRTNVPFQFELPLTYLILEREFIRESDHSNPDFAQLCGDWGRILLNLARGAALQ